MQNAYNDSYGGGISDVYVAKFSSTGSLLWSTYLGGADFETAVGIATDSQGNCIVVGQTNSPDFTTKNANDSVYNTNGDGFIAKYTAAGVLSWSTFIGGSGYDEAMAVVVDQTGNITVVGDTYSANFPVLKCYDNSRTGSEDIFVLKLNATGGVQWGTYFGGTGTGLEEGYAITADLSGNYIIAGRSTSDSGTGIPLPNAYNSTRGGGDDVYVLKMNGAGFPVWGTFLGGNTEDIGFGIVSDNAGNVYVTGSALSPSFTILGGFDNILDGYDGFVAKYDTTGTLKWSTFVGGDGVDMGLAIALDNAAGVYILADTTSTNFPTLNPSQASRAGASDVAIVKLSDAGDLLWGTYYGGSGDDDTGGIAIDNSLNLYITGNSSSSSIPGLSGYDISFNGNADSFLSRFLFNPEAPTLMEITPNPTSDGQIALDWTDAARAGDYKIYRDVSTIQTVSGLTPITTTIQSQVTDTLTASGTYYYAVVAVNAAGNSVLSNVMSVVVNLSGWGFVEWFILTEYLVFAGLFLAAYWTSKIPKARK